MKATLLSIYKVALLPVILFFVPIYMMVFLVGLSTLIDTAFGIWKSKALKEEVSSKKCRKGLVPKLRSYFEISSYLNVLLYQVIQSCQRDFPFTNPIFNPCNIFDGHFP